MTMAEKKKRPDCYKCIHRGDLPGNAHSTCNHPDAPVGGNLSSLLSMLGGMKPPPMPSGELNVVGNPHGIMNGWFSWPYNFDPVWLESCDGFERKKGEQVRR